MTYSGFATREIYTTGATCGTGTGHPSGAHELNSVILLVLVGFVLFMLGGYVLCMSFVFIYEYWCPTRFPYQMMFVSYSSNTTGVTCGAGTANPYGVPEFTPGFLVGFVSLGL